MKKRFTMTNAVLVFLSIIIVGGGAVGLISIRSGQEVRTKPKPQDHTNRLINEKSPYLLQHAHNPVDWYPWGDEAFEKARRENKPIFLSIGYSTCHWCHVMNRESFSTKDVAQLMNDAFVSIKVDREERPDIDHLYMNFSLMMTGSGGWPLTIVMTPDKKPFFVATYVPKDTRFGRTGLMELIPRIKDAWRNRHDKIMESADKIAAALRNGAGGNPGGELGASTLKTAYLQLTRRYDERYGGFGKTTKFPAPHNLLFLLRYWKRTGEPKALAMVEKTLQAMRTGGMYDHIGFGFHRYSTEPTWRVPHFEKMIYDQAMLAIAYTEAYQATGKKEYAETAREIFTYVLRDMTSPEGGFYSAENADSEGVEGKFYKWTKKELVRVLGASDAGLMSRVFGVKKTGQSILHMSKPLSKTAAELKMSLADLRMRIERSREKLFRRREKRIHPEKDDKVLTDWNGLMIAALAKGARVLGEPKYAEAAERAADFVRKELVRENGRLFHRYRKGQSAINAYADDYAFLTWGLLELYETTFDVSRLRTAINLNKVFEKHFWDKENGGFFFSADDDEALLVRRKEIRDGAIPSGNSVAMLNLLRLGKITADAELEKKADAVIRAFSGEIGNDPSGSDQLMVGLDFGLGPSYEVVIVGNSGAADTMAMLKVLRESFIPDKVVFLKPAEISDPEITKIAEFTKYQTSRDGKATAYVCFNYSCKLPTTDPGKMLELLKGQ